MSTMLAPEIRTLEPPEAAHGRFFYEKHDGERLAMARDVFDFARDFSLRYADLLPEEVGVVLQAGLDSNGALVDLDDEQKKKSITLYFDARQQEAAQYAWQLTEAHDDGREVYRLHTDRHSYEVTRLSFDVQGRLRLKTSDRNNTALAAKIQSLAQHQYLRESAQKIRNGQAKLERELATFSVTEVMKMSPALYEKELATKQKTIDHLGFVALTPLGG